MQLRVAYCGGCRAPGDLWSLRPPAGDLTSPDPSNLVRCREGTPAWALLRIATSPEWAWQSALRVRGDRFLALSGFSRRSSSQMPDFHRGRYTAFCVFLGPLSPKGRSVVLDAAHADTVVNACFMLNCISRPCRPRPSHPELGTDSFLLDARLWYNGLVLCGGNSILVADGHAKHCGSWAALAQNYIRTCAQLHWYLCRRGRATCQRWRDS